MSTNENAPIALFANRNETLYIVSSPWYTTKGYFRVSTSADISAACRPTLCAEAPAQGDDLYILRKVSTHDARFLEARVHDNLSMVAAGGGWFQFPYMVICKNIDVMNQQCSEIQEVMDRITRTMSKLSIKDQNEIRHAWCDKAAGKTVKPPDNK